MTFLRWTRAILLLWGLFTGLSWLLVPILVDGWGDTGSAVAGAILIVACAAALLMTDPRRGKVDQASSLQTRIGRNHSPPATGAAGRRRSPAGSRSSSPARWRYSSRTNS